MLRRLINPLCSVVFLCVPAMLLADSSARKKDGITVCTDYPAGVYRPYNTVRRVKLAAAYFVNPTLPDKSEILNMYSLADLVKGQQTDKLWDSLQKGTLKVAAPVMGNENAFVPIDAKDFLLLSALCSDGGNVSTEKPKPASIAYKSLIDFSSKSSFKGSIDKLGLQSLGGVRLVSEQPIAGVAPQQQYISWDPGENVSVSVGATKAMRK